MLLLGFTVGRGRHTFNSSSDSCMIMREWRRPAAAAELRVDRDVFAELRKVVRIDFGAGRKKRLVLFALFVSEIVGITVLSLPSLMLFRNFAFADWGTNFTLQYLVSKGLRPNVDFGYQYGALALLLGHLWFAAAGATPRGYLEGMLLCNLLVAWALARLAVQLKLGKLALVFVVVTLPYAFQVCYPNFAHGIEAALLANALAEQARGRRDIALALTGLGCFAKPSLSYVYGLILVIVILARLGPKGLRVRNLAQVFGPAAFTVMGTLILLFLQYGAVATVRTLSPAAGAATYRAYHFGFFTGIGRSFWWPPHPQLRYYLSTVAGFWLAGTIWLICNGTAAAYRIWLGSGNRVLEVVLTCAILHFAFVTLMFGSPLSWIYYTYILVIGLAVTEASSIRFASSALRLLTILAVFGHATTLFVRWRFPQLLRPDIATGGLLAESEERDEWIGARALVRGRDAAVATDLGDANLMFSEFEKPQAGSLLPGIALPSEVDREAQRLRRAQIIIVPHNHFPGFASISEALSGTSKVLDGEYFSVYQRGLRRR
jgi:hypothetical protein